MHSLGRSGDIRLERSDAGCTAGGLLDDPALRGAEADIDVALDASSGESAVNAESKEVDSTAWSCCCSLSCCLVAAATTAAAFRAKLLGPGSLCDTDAHP